MVERWEHDNQMQINVDYLYTGNIKSKLRNTVLIH